MNAAAASTARVIGAVRSEPAADFWAQLVNARTSDQLCQAWLGILCQWIPGAQAGLLLLQQPDAAERYAPAAVWPEPDRDLSFMAGVAQQALMERRGATLEGGDGMVQWAYPLLGAEQSYGVVVLHVVMRGDAAMRDALRLLHWGAGWLVGLFDRRQLLAGGARLERSGLLQDLLLGLLNEGEPEAAARWVVNRVADGLPARTALLGRAEAGRVALQAVSGSASFDARSHLLVLAREAMQEAADRQLPLCFPAPGSTASLIEPGAVADYQRASGAAAVVALPLLYQARVSGALLIELDAVPEQAFVDFLQTLALALAPGLALQRGATRSLSIHARESLRDARDALVGPRHAGLKLAGVAAALGLAAAALLPVTYRIGAVATVEGRVQRAAVAPFAGFVQEAKARAGDSVKAGDVLARLDDRELKLEDGKWSAQVELADRKLRESMARADAVAVRLAQAELGQAQAELALVRERLSRTAITAPFDGIVVRGDWSQQLGAPVEQGKAMFEVAPLDSYRVMLKVDERDVARLTVGQPAELVLAGLSGERFALTVRRIAPVATAENGVNSFRVEAELANPSPRIQPGMEGVAKVEAGTHSLLWVGLHRAIDALRYSAWSLGL
ncbi:MAG TPA: efflux RND transporter periplasmic adaptor subunit [Roseateles sp.]